MINTAHRLFIICFVVLYLFPFNVVSASELGCRPIPQLPSTWWCTGSVSCADGTWTCAQTCPTDSAEGYCKPSPGGCDVQCGGGGGGGTCDGGGSVPVWVRIYSVENGEVISWKPSGDGILGNDANGDWSVPVAEGGGLDANGNFRLFKPAYVNYFNGAQSTWGFDTFRNRQDSAMSINITPITSTGKSILHSNKNWSHSFCPGGIADRDTLQIHQRPNTGECGGPIFYTCRANRIDCNDDDGKYKVWCERDYDGCIDPQFRLGVRPPDNGAYNWISPMGKYLKYMIDDIAGEVPAGAEALAGRWALSYIVEDDCASLTTKFTLAPPTGYICKSVNVKGHSGREENKSQSLTHETAFTVNSDDSCTVEFNPRSGGNLVLLEIEPTPAIPPTGKVIQPSITQTKFCMNSWLPLEFSAETNPPYIINYLRMFAHSTSWPIGGNWLQLTGDPGSYSPPGTSRYYREPIQLLHNYYTNINGFRAFEYGQYYYLAMSVRNNASPQMLCSGNPLITYPSGAFEYCGNPIYNTAPWNDPTSNRPHRTIKIVNAVPESVAILPVVRQVGFNEVRWSYNTPSNIHITDDILGFNVYRNGVLINATPIQLNPNFGLNYYSYNDTTCSDLSYDVTYTVQVVMGYTWGGTTFNCDSQSTFITTQVCPINRAPICTLNSPASPVYIGDTVNLNYSISTFSNLLPGIDYERDLVNYLSSLTGITSSVGGFTNSNPLPNPLIPHFISNNIATNVGNHIGVITFSNISSASRVVTVKAGDYGGETCEISRTITPIVSYLRLSHNRNTNVYTNLADYCPSGLSLLFTSIPPASTLSYTIQYPPITLGSTIFNSAFSPPISSPWGYQIRPGNYTTGGVLANYATSATDPYEIKCIRRDIIRRSDNVVVNTQNFTNSSRIALGNVLDDHDVRFYIVTGPVLNSQSWFQATGGSSQFTNLGTFAKPANLSTVSATYKTNADVFLFKEGLATTNPFGRVGLGSFIYSTGVDSTLIETSKFKVSANGNTTLYNNYKRKNIDLFKRVVNDLRQANGEQTADNNGTLNARLNSNSNNIIVITNSSIGINPLITYSNNLVNPYFAKLVYRSGDLTISGNITASAPIESRKPVIFFVDGNITIGANVTRLDGIFIATGSITINGHNTSSDSQLVVNGSLIAKNSIEVDRNLTSTPTQNNDPVLQINYNPRTYFMRSINNITVNNVYFNMYD